MTITPRSVQKWVQERVQNDPYNLHAKNPCGFHATLFVQRLTRTLAGSASLDGHKGPGKPTVPGVHAWGASTRAAALAEAVARRASPRVTPGAGCECRARMPCDQGCSQRTQSPGTRYSRPAVMLA